jgi:hypothetical protein
LEASLAYTEKTPYQKKKLNKSNKRNNNARLDLFERQKNSPVKKRLIRSGTVVQTCSHSYSGDGWITGDQPR